MSYDDTRDEVLYPAWMEAPHDGYDEDENRDYAEESYNRDLMNGGDL